MNEEKNTPSQTTGLQTTVAGAERVMAQALGGAVRLGDVEVLRGDVHPRVLRAQVLAAPSDSCPKIVIKRYGVRSDGGYDPAEAQKPWGGLLSEWAGARFLDGLGTVPRLGPRCFGGDADAGIVVTKDLGDGKSLADVLQGNDREALESGLLQYCASLGRLHGATVGRAAELEASWSEAGVRWAVSETPYRQAESWPRENLAPFREGCDALGIRIAPGFEGEAGGVWRAMAHPGPFLAFTPGDTCPDNHRLTSNGYARFFDFEACGFRHALLDLAYGFVPFPTCWCVLRLPAALAPLMSEAYRRELVRGCPEAADDEVFFAALAHACASWMVSAVSWNLNEALEREEAVGLASQRQRLVLHLDAFSETDGWLGRLPALRDAAGAMARVLHDRWGEESEISFYPAYRS